MASIFVGGSQRSGTSIMQQLLCQSPETNPYIFECSYLQSLVGCYRDARNHWSRNHASYFGDTNGLREFSSLITRAFLEQTALRLGGCKHLVLKEPFLTQFWPDLFELAPDSVFLLMVRDPRDTIASMLEVGRKQKELGQQYLFAEGDIPQLCEHFLAFYRPALECPNQEFRNRLAVVLYEDLVQNPKQTLRDIARFTGIPFDEIDVDERPDSGHVERNLYETSPLYAPWVTPVSGENVSPSRIGAFRDVLTDEQTRDVERHCQSFFEWFGYVRKAA